MDEADNDDGLRERLQRMREEHRELDVAIGALEAAGSTDLLHIRRLKKRKLQLKDEIRCLADRVLPDIIA